MSKCFWKPPLQELRVKSPRLLHLLVFLIVEEIKGTPWFCSGLCCFLAPSEPVIVGKTHRDKGEVSKSAEEAAAGKVCFSFLLSSSTCSGLEQCLKPLLLVSFESNGIELIPQSLDFDTQIIRISHLALNVKFEFFSFYFFRNEVTQAAVPLADGPGAHIQALLYPGQGARSCQAQQEGPGQEEPTGSGCCQLGPAHSLGTGLHRFPVPWGRGRREKPPAWAGQRPLR